MVVCMTITTKLTEDFQNGDDPEDRVRYWTIYEDGVATDWEVYKCAHDVPELRNVVTGEEAYLDNFDLRSAIPEARRIVADNPESWLRGEISSFH